MHEQQCGHRIQVFEGAWHERWERLLRDTVETFVRKKLAAGPLQRMLGAVMLGEVRLQRVVSQARALAALDAKFVCGCGRCWTGRGRSRS